MRRIKSMLMRTLLALSALLMIASADAAPKPKSTPEPKPCPVAEPNLEAIEQAINTAASCDASMAVFEACSFGASGDIPLGQAVVDKCEGDFLEKLGAVQ